MKGYFSHSSFVVDEFDGKAKKQSLIVSCLLILLFIISSLTFFNLLYAFADIAGSIVSGNPDVAIKDFLRSVPLFLSFFAAFWGVLALQAFYRHLSAEKLARSNMKCGIAIIIFSGVGLLYPLIGLITGEYISLVEGSPSPIYPLDSMIFAAVFLALGILLVVYRKKWAKAHPYVVPTRGPVVRRARGLYCTFLSFWCLFACFGLTAGVATFFIYDFLHGAAFYGIATAIAYLLSPIYLLVWEFYFNELKEEKRKEILLPLSILGLIVSAVSTGLYFASLGANLDAPSNAGFGMFPVAFAASVNIATMLTVLVPFIVSVVALIRGLIASKAK